ALLEAGQDGEEDSLVDPVGRCGGPAGGRRLGGASPARVLPRRCLGSAVEPHGPLLSLGRSRPRSRGSPPGRNAVMAAAACWSGAGALLTACRAVARVVARGRPDPAANLRIQVDKPRFSEEIGERPAALSTIGTRALHLRVGAGASSCRAAAGLRSPR